MWQYALLHSDSRHRGGLQNTLLTLAGNWEFIVSLN